MMEILFTFSILINVLMIWYIVQLLKRYLLFQEELDSFIENLSEYEQHVDVVGNLQKFYGDETLANLMRHSKEIVKDCNDLRFIVTADQEEEEEEEAEETYVEETQ